MKVQAPVQCPAIFEAAAEIAAHIGMILAHTQYGKGSEKPKHDGKNPYYISYHCVDVVGGDIGIVPMELGKTALKYWTCRGPHFLYHCSNCTGSFFGAHQKKKKKPKKL